jgi:hypothetical protein
VIGPRVLAALWIAAAVGLAVPIAPAAGPGDDEAYPADITPPPGTQYPCALTALPRTLTGVPESERGYIERVYGLVIRGIHAKLLVLKAVEGSEASARGTALVRYQAATESVVSRISALAPPAGLEPFRDDVAAAFRLQRTFFEKAVEARRSGGSMDDVWRIAEGRQASGRLIVAWGRMQARYPQWSRETSDSVYHHLCALDLF